MFSGELNEKTDALGFLGRFEEKLLQDSFGRFFSRETCGRLLGQSIVEDFSSRLAVEFCCRLSGEFCRRLAGGISRRVWRKTFAGEFGGRLLGDFCERFSG